MLDDAQADAPPHIATEPKPGKKSGRPAMQRVVRQLLEALLFEECLDYIAVSRGTPAGCTFYFSLGKRDFVCPGRLRGFGRIHLEIADLAELSAGKKQPVVLAEILVWAIDAVRGDKAAKNRFLSEILQSAYWLDWNQTNLPPRLLQPDLSLPELEGALWDGHPYHPCSKTRTGFTPYDNARYGYEAGRPFQLYWVAVARSAMQTNLRSPAGEEMSTAEFYRRFANGSSAFQQMSALSLNCADYVPVPVHPWQWHNVLLPKIASSNHQIVSLGECGDFYVASQSQRTLMNISSPGAADVKLPLDLVCTSSRRCLQNHGVCSAPAISTWLSGCVAADDFFHRHPLKILREFAGLRVDHSVYGGEDESAVCQLGAIWRESVLPDLAHDERAVPMTALLAEEPNGSAFIDGWVRHYGVTSWLAQLFSVFVLPIWHLLARHGIAVEAHAQNAILIHRNGWPVRLALRDFHESLEFVPDFLATKENVPDFAALDPVYRDAPPDRFYWMDSVEALRELVMDTVFIFHLSDLANLYQKHFQLSEGEFWHMLAELLRDYAEQGHCAAERLSELGYKAPLINAESLVRKKLWDYPQSEYHHQVKNPFYETR